MVNGDTVRSVCSDSEGPSDLALVCLGDGDLAGSCLVVGKNVAKGTSSEELSAQDEALALGTSTLAGLVMGDSEGLNLDEPGESYLGESRGLDFGDATLECLAMAELAVTSAGEGRAVCDNGFECACVDSPDPKRLIREDSAPTDDCLECPDPEDATRELATLVAAALEGAVVEGPPKDGLPSKTDAL